MSKRRVARIWPLALGLAWLVAAPVAATAEPAHEAPTDAAAQMPELVPEGASLSGGTLEPTGSGVLVATRSLTRIERAWHAPAASLEQRLTRMRRTALELGAWNLDPAAHALVTGEVDGQALERARGAVLLAPDSPTARMALARALWLHGDAPMSAIRSVIEALRAISRHLEAALWFAGSGLYVLAVALVLGGALTLLVAFALVAAHAAHDLGHLVSSNTPAFGGYALLASLLLLPLAFGEGALGIALVAFGVTLPYARAGQRVALVLAAAAILAGIYPVIRSAGMMFEAFPSDPVARATYTIAHGFASPVDVARLEAAAERDPLAARGLAIHARRMGNLGQADALYQQLLEDRPDDPVLINNAANVRLALGHMESALELYRRSIEFEASPVVLFNLSQAYGRAFQVDDLNHTLEQAQLVDAELVATLTTLQGGAAEEFVVDLALPNRLIWDRILASERGEGIAAEFRAPIAPGSLGRGARKLGVAVGAIALIGTLIGMRFQGSGGCGRCGGRICSRCGESGEPGDPCEDCKRLFQHPEKTDRALRLERVNALRAREERIERITALASMLVPGAAGILANRPLASPIGGFCFALALAALLWRDGVVPDPLVAGSAAPLAFLGVSVLALIGYFTVAATTLASRRSR